MATEQPQPGEMSDAEHQRLTVVIQKLMEAEPQNWLSLLEKIADMPATNPGMYNTAKSFLGL